MLNADLTLFWCNKLATSNIEVNFCFDIVLSPVVFSGGADEYPNRESMAVNPSSFSGNGLERQKRQYFLE